MSTHQGTTHRRKFLGMVATGAAAIGVAALSRPLGLAAAMKNSPGSTDLAGFDSWLGQIKGAHKQVFDSPDPKGGMPLAWTRVFLMTNSSVGVPTGDACAVLILRHDSIPLAMPDAMWAKYSLGEVFKIDERYAERQIDHLTKAPDGTAYDRTAFMPERRLMMQLWADYLDELRAGAKVLPLTKAQ